MVKPNREEIELLTKNLSLRKQLRVFRLKLKTKKHFYEDHNEKSRT